MGSHAQGGGVIRVVRRHLAARSRASVFAVAAIACRARSGQQSSTCCSSSTLPPTGRYGIGPFFDFVLARNTGISYGLFQTAGPARPVGAARPSRRSPWCCSGSGLRGPNDRLTALSLGLIIGGAVGNAIDRLAYGWVADFVFFHISTAELAVQLVCF